MKKIMFNDKYGLTEAVLEGRKTMTRRLIRTPRTMDGKDVYGFSVVSYRNGEIVEVMAVDEDGAMINNILPKYKVGEVVAVAQNYMDAGYDRNTIQRAKFRTNAYGGEQIGDFEICLLPGWKNKMYVYPSMMPHQIRITNIRVERLQNISDENCFREGVVRYTCNLYEFQGTCYSYEGDKNKMGTYKTAREAFAALIDKVSGNGTWESNPWVFVYEFELIK